MFKKIASDAYATAKNLGINLLVENSDIQELYQYHRTHKFAKLVKRNNDNTINKTETKLFIKDKLDDFFYNNFSKDGYAVIYAVHFNEQRRAVGVVLLRAG